MRDERTTNERQTFEDRATQPMEAWGWVLQKENSKHRQDYQNEDIDAKKEGALEVGLRGVKHILWQFLQHLLFPLAQLSSLREVWVFGPYGTRTRTRTFWTRKRLSKRRGRKQRYIGGFPVTGILGWVEGVKHILWQFLQHLLFSFSVLISDFLDTAIHQHIQRFSEHSKYSILTLHWVFTEQV